MRTIWKFEIPYDGLETGLSNPQVVHVAIDPANPDSDLPSIWLQHDEYMTRHPTRFHFVGTGHPVNELSVHVGSCITRQGLVWHVYRETSP